MLAWITQRTFSSNVFAFTFKLRLSFEEEEIVLSSSVCSCFTHLPASFAQESLSQLIREMLHSSADN
jgi:hypothetical protein